MEVEQMNFVTHLTINTVQQLIIYKTCLLKFGQISFIGKSQERISCKLSKSEILRLYSIVRVAMETIKIFHRYIFYLPSSSL